MPISEADFVQRYQDGMSNPKTAQKYKDGISKTTVNPMEEAAKADDRFLQAVTDSVQSGRRAAALRAVSVTTWKNNALNVGANRLATGAQKAADKMRSVAAKFVPVYNQISEQVRQMPKGGEANAVNRMLAARRALRSAAGKLPD